MAFRNQLRDRPLVESASNQKNDVVDHVGVPVLHIEKTTNIFISRMIFSGTAIGIFSVVDTVYIAPLERNSSSGRTLVM